MDAEQLDITRRTVRFAALGDPARLQMVDLLAVGDRSPLDLQERLGISSSLLSHHLNVLERSGLIIRSRSEADRRRSYVRLLPGALDDLMPGVTSSAERILFVCTANSARSQLAAALWRRSSDVPAESAGTHPAAAIAPGAADVARRHGLELPERPPRWVEDVMTPSDLVVTVCDAANEELARTGALHWSIPDPVAAGTPEAFDRAFDEIVRRIDRFAPRLISNGVPS